MSAKKVIPGNPGRVATLINSLVLHFYHFNVSSDEECSFRTIVHFSILIEPNDPVQSREKKRQVQTETVEVWSPCGSQYFKNFRKFSATLNFLQIYYHLMYNR